MQNPESIPVNETHKFLWDFEIQNQSFNFGRTTRHSDSLQKKGKTPHPAELENFAIPAYHWVKLKESEKRST